MQVGNILIPAVRTFQSGQISRPIETIPGLGHRGYNLAEFEPELPQVTLQGYLLQKYGSARTLYQLKEDAEALIGRRIAYNYVSDVKGRTGWISVTSVDVDDNAGTLWPVLVEGTWFDAGQYKEEYSANPVTRSNDFGITGSYDLATVTAASDVRCLDGSTEIYSPNHIFAGSCSILNGLYMVTLSENTISVYYYNEAYIKIDDFEAGTFDRVTVLDITEDAAKVKTDNGIEITLERGRVPHIDSPVDLTCSILSPVDQSTDTENYLTLGSDLYVCSDESFSITSNVIDAGDLWIFRATADVVTVAENCLVVSNLKRQVVVR